MISDAVKQILFYGNNKVVFIMNYGSYSNNTFHNGSDIDLCIYYNGTLEERQKFRLSMLSSLNDIFDVQIFQDLPLYIRKDVLNGKLLYMKDKSIYEIARNTIEEFEDFRRGYYDAIGLEKII
ncbi:nucleotidyltransferase domain-containing protein [Ferroplasma acidarmanus]|uniref:Nucleotidyltransferase n=1 Tax=Ferroplasma acidarmanus Fer1 TaxID=333146 RepID=S0AQK1_FERAC|nr:nucleotidyltransferase domain-containing protein [Ferroplasma acidarmanus]AGO60305.1 Nucleotidyltransferase [Ferroplasma acidarmanus Fer1]